MNAPVDIIISIINQMIAENTKERDAVAGLSPVWYVLDGKVVGLQELRDRLEGFKKLFN